MQASSKLFKQEASKQATSKQASKQSKQANKQAKQSKQASKPAKQASKQASKQGMALSAVNALMESASVWLLTCFWLCAMFLLVGARQQNLVLPHRFPQVCAHQPLEETSSQADT